MPVHDWTRIDAGTFHAFHQTWSVFLQNTLNSGRLPPDYFAIVEQRIQGPIPDVLTLHLEPGPPPEDNGTIGCTVATAPPRARVIKRSEADLYAERADRVTVRHRQGEAVAVIEIVSPGNKASQAGFDSFVEKASSLIRKGIHLLAIDLFPPGPRDPHGIAKAIWDQFQEEDFDLPPDKPLTVASFDAGPLKVVYVEPVAVGDVLPDMPLFLKPEFYVPAPLEESYQAAWAGFPAALKRLLEGPAPPQSG